MPTPEQALSRRDALKTALAFSAVAAVAAAAGGEPSAAPKPDSAPKPGEAPKPDPSAPWFTISLAQWSLHKTLFAGKLDHLDFPKAALKDYGIDAVEYVNAFFKTKTDPAGIKELKKRCDDLGVTSVLIMCDGEGRIGDPDAAKRQAAVDNHLRWVEAAKALGCHSIRLNAESEGSPDEQRKLVAAGLRALCEAADPFGINVIIENHWGLSSQWPWLMGVMKDVGHARVGTLPDFGNFPDDVDRFESVAKMMPVARGVSAKSYDFNAATGEHVQFDFSRMLAIVKDAGYRGRIGIEYEGKTLDEPAGIRATRDLLLKLGGKRV
jgi:L-ribulose-5-phosphate 3-epimerase